MSVTTGWTGHVTLSGGEPTAVQTTRPRDLGALFLVIGVLVVLLVISIVLGSPSVR